MMVIIEKIFANKIAFGICKTPKVERRNRGQGEELNLRINCPRKYLVWMLILSLSFFSENA